MGKNFGLLSGLVAKLKVKGDRGGFDSDRRRLGTILGP